MFFRRGTLLLVSTSMFVQSVSPAFAMEGDSVDKIEKKSSKSPIRKIKNISEMDRAGVIVRPGDWIVFDIDQTVLREGRAFNQEVLNLDPKVVEMVKDWQVLNTTEVNPQKHITIIFLTARSFAREEATKEQLKKAGFPENIEIIFAPNDRRSGAKTSTKGNALIQRLEKAQVKPHRIIMIDDLKENLMDVYNSLQNNETHRHLLKSLKLLKRKVNTKIYESSDLLDRFPKELTGLTYVKSIIGGSGGVHVLRDAKGQLFTFKSVEKSEQMKEEILADALYRSLGVNVPSFAVYDHLPDIREIRNACTGPGPYRLAQFIEKDEKATRDSLAQKMREHFVADALLSNFDIVIGNFKNVDLDKNGTLWRLDNGGSLRFRALGASKFGLKDWDAYKVNELETMRQTTDGIFAYGSLTGEDLKTQAQDILNRSPALFRTLNEMATKLHLHNPSEVREMLRLRLDDLAKKYLLTPLDQEKGTDFQVMDGFMAPRFGAGILPYSIDPQTGQKVILLGKRVGHNWWCNFGGSSDLNKGLDPDKTLADTAAREVLEESLGYLSFTAQELAHKPSHGILNSAGVFYRMFIAQHPYVGVERLKKALSVPDYGWQHEYSEYRWVPLNLFMEDLAKNHTVEEESMKTVKVGDMILYPYFWEMLKESPVKNTLTNICAGKKVRATHTHDGRVQRVVSPLSVEDEKQQLAKTVVKKGFVLGQIKTRRPFAAEDAIDHFEEIQTMSGFLKEDEVKDLRKIMREAPYTQTQAYLHHIMGEKVYDSLEGQSELEVNTFLEEFAKCFNIRSRDKNSIDSQYTQILIKALDNEKKNKEKVVFYHGTDSLTCFLWDIFTAYRSQLKNLQENQLTTFRGLEKRFSSILDVDAFINTYKEIDGKVSNYKIVNDIHYADLGLSVNPFLFGNDGNLTSATYYLFYIMSSVQPTKQEDLFNAFMTETGIPGKFKDYKALFQQYYLCNDKFNSKLFQIFLDPQIVDCVSYMSVVGGDVITVLNDSVPYYGFAKIISELRTPPEKCNEKLQDRLSGKLGSSRDLNDLQGRIFLNPKIFYNPRYVSVNTYWRHPLSDDMEKSYSQKLNGQVSQDLARWLAQHCYLDSQTFVEGMPALKKSYRYVYEEEMKLPYIEQQSKDLLPSAIKNGNFQFIKEILEKHPNIDINEKIQPITYREEARVAIVPLSFLTPDTPNFSEIVKIFVERGLNTIEQLEIKEELQNKILNELFLYQDKLSQELSNSFNNLLGKKKNQPPRHLIELMKKGYTNLVSYILNEINELDVKLIRSDELPILVNILKTNKTLKKLKITEKDKISVMELLLREKEIDYKQAPWFKNTWDEFMLSPLGIINETLEKEFWALRAHILNIIENVNVLDWKIFELRRNENNHNQEDHLLIEGLKKNSTLKDLQLSEHTMWEVMTKLMVSPPGPFSHAPWFSKAREELFDDPEKYLRYAQDYNEDDAILLLLKNAPQEMELGRHLKYKGPWMEALIKGLSNNEAYAQLNLSGIWMDANLLSSLADALAVNTKLTSLNLKDCGISGEKVKFLAQGLKKNTTLAKLSLSKEEMLDVMGFLVKDSEGTFRQAPWFDVAWKDILEDSHESIKRAVKQKNNELIFQIINNEKIEHLDLTAFDYCYEHSWIDPVLKGLENHKTIQTLKVKSGDFDDAARMKKLTKMLQANSTLKRLELNGPYDLNEVSEKIFIEMLTRNTFLEDLIFQYPRQKLKILNHLYPYKDKLAGGLKKWTENAMIDLTSNLTTNLRLCCANTYLEHLVSFMLGHLSELKMANLYRVPVKFWDSLEKNKTISVADFEFCGNWRNSPIPGLANILRGTNSIHTLRLRNYISRADATALSEALIKNKTFNTLAFSNATSSESLLEGKSLAILADAVKKTHFSKILKVLPENELDLLDEVISHKEYMSSYWHDWMVPLWEKISSEAPLNLKKAIQSGHKNLALAILATGKVKELSMENIYLGEKQKDVLEDVLKNDKMLQSISGISDFGYEIFLKLMPVQDQLSKGAQEWIQNTWNALLENPEKSIEEVLGHGYKNEFIERLLKKAHLRMLTLSEMTDEKILLFFNSLENNTLLERVSLSGEIYDPTSVSQALYTKKNIALKILDLKECSFPYGIKDYEFKYIKNILENNKDLKIIMSENALKALAKELTAPLTESGQLIIHEEKHSESKESAHES